MPLSLSLSLSLCPQSKRPDFRKHGIPGSKPGTERWLVRFDRRSFTLDELRTAIRTKDTSARARRLVSDLRAKAKADQKPVEDLVKSLGGALEHNHWLANACTVSVAHKDLPRLAKHAGVVSLVPDRYRRPTSHRGPTRSLIRYSMDANNHDAVWVHGQRHPLLGEDDKIEGQGVTIGILDTGCNAGVKNTSPARPHRSFYINGKINGETGFEKVIGGIVDSRLMSIMKSYPRPPLAPVNTLDMDDTAKHPIYLGNPPVLVRAWGRHGTGVAAVAAGAPNGAPYGAYWGGNGSGTVGGPGHAPRAKLRDYRLIVEEFGSGQNPTIYTGYSDDTTMLLALEALVADKVTDPSLKVANLSFEGSFDPMHPVSIAMDNAVEIADILMTSSAGNFGPNTEPSLANVNGLSVGAATPENPWSSSHRVAVFSPPPPISMSALGPIFGDHERTFPDLVANGSHIFLPVAHREAPNTPDNYNSSGTSYAAPQVAGAAALFRSVKPTADAFETKAAILATTKDISGVTPAPTWPLNDRNAWGLGYLYDKRLIQLLLPPPPSGPGVHGLSLTATLTSSIPDSATPFSVTPGNYYAVAIAWPRKVPTKAWTDLDLAVIDTSGKPIAASSSTRNTYEKVVFKAPAGQTTVTIEVKGEFLDSSTVPVGIAAVDLGTASVPREGDWKSYGAGCAGTSPKYTLGNAMPRYDANQFGKRILQNTNPVIPIGGRFFGTMNSQTDTRLAQFLFDPIDPLQADEVRPSFTANGIALRRWAPHPSPSGTPTIQISMAIGQTWRAPVYPHPELTSGKIMTNSFTVNRVNDRGQPSPPLVQFTPVISWLQPRSLTLGTAPWSVESPDTWPVRIMFDTPFVYDSASDDGPYILIEVTVKSGTGDQSWIVDWVEDTTNVNGITGQTTYSRDVSSLLGLNAGDFTQGRGPIVAFLTQDMEWAPGVHTLNAYGRPRIGAWYGLHLFNATTLQPSWIYTGVSDSTWQGLTLPLDMTPLGAPGCFLLASQEANTPGAVDASGNFLLRVFVPNDTTLIGSRVYHQEMTLDGGANALGQVYSNGLQAVIGG